MRCTERCPNCPSCTKPELNKPIVSGEWNNPSIVFVGDTPNQESSNRQKVFSGKFAEEFANTYLPLAGLDRQHISLTNTVKCHWEDGDSPDWLVKSCAEFHLRQELAYYQPKYVVLMGSTANSLLGLDVDMEHGMMRHTELLGWKGTVFSTHHPALGLHKSDKMLAMVDKLDGDFPRLKLLLRGQLKELKDEVTTEYSRLNSVRRIRAVLARGMGNDFSIAVDTESKKTWRGFQATTKYTPWCVTFAMWPGEAFMIRMSDEDAFAEFSRQINKFWRVIFHNSAYDHEILRMAGANVDWSRTYDTMQMAYDDGRLPKGLKALSYRLLGKRMTSFDDTVVPHSREVAIKYLEDAMTRVWPARDQDWTGDMVQRNCSDCGGKGQVSNGLRGKMRKLYPCDCDGGKVTVKKMTRKHGLTEKLNLLAGSMTRKSDIDLWKRWEDWTDNDPVGMQLMIDTMGPIPLPSIEYVPEAEAIEYACGDAHETLRIFPIIQERLVNLRRSFNQ